MACMHRATLAGLLCVLFYSTGGVRRIDNEPEKVIAQIEEEEAPKARVMILGGPKTGKSTLCQWLLGRTDLCGVYSSMWESTTELELASGHWFNDSTLGELAVLDTPAFQLSDDETWINFTEYAMTNTFDMVIFCLPLSREVGRFDLDILNKFRKTFGSEMWEKSVAFVPVVQGWQALEHHAYDGLTEDHWTSVQEFWREGLEQVELNHSTTDLGAPYNSHAREILEGQLADIKFYGSQLRVVSPYWPMVSASSPDFSREGWHQSPEFTSRRLATTRLTDLTEMRLEILSKIAGGVALRVAAEGHS